MKLKFVVVDLEISPRLRRWTLRLGIPLASLIGGTAIAYAAGLKTWATGDLLSASDLNDNFANLQTQLDTIVPPGTVMAFGGAIDGNPGEVINDKAPARLPPAGWLLCNGALVARKGVYAALFSTIENKFGAGDGVSTFGLPDLRGQFVRGLDISGKVDDAGRTLGSTELDSLKAHTHPACQYFSGSNLQAGGFSYCGSSGVAESGTTGAAGASETRPKNLAMNYIIKY